jgi:protease I
MEMSRQQITHRIICLGLTALLLVGCGSVQVQPTATPIPIQETPTSVSVAPVPTTPAPTLSSPLTRLDGKRALFVLYSRFQQDEYSIPRAILEQLGVKATVASSSLDIRTGTEGAKVQPDLLLGDVYGGDYDAIVFVGGIQYEVDNLDAQRIAQEAVAEGKVVAAICVAPVTLARAGLVEGKRVTAGTMWNELEAAGATVLTGASVERDGLIITADGPGRSRKFGETIAAALGE